MTRFCSYCHRVCCLTQIHSNTFSTNDSHSLTSGPERERNRERDTKSYSNVPERDISHMKCCIFCCQSMVVFFFKSIVCLLCLTKSQNCSLACCSLLLTLMSLLISTKWWKLLVIVQIFPPLFIIDIVLHLLAVLISQAFKIRLKNYSPVYHTFRIFHWHWQLLRRLSWHHTT